MAKKYNIYQESKIYKLQHYDGHFYIGSTTQNLCSRLSDHRRKSKLEDRKNVRVYDYITNNGGWENVKLVLLEKLLLNGREELVREEDKYIQTVKNNPFCLNTKSATANKEKDESKVVYIETVNNQYNKYNNSKIYKVFSDEGYFHYGSTVANLNERLREHMNSSKTSNMKMHIYFNSIGWDNAKIELVSEHDFYTRKKLLEEENKYIKNSLMNPKCLNQCESTENIQAVKDTRRIYEEGHTEERKTYRENHRNKINAQKKEHYETNKKSIRKKQKEYYMLNRDKILESSMVKISCECGSLCSKNHLSRHLQSLKHINFINSSH